MTDDDNSILDTNMFAKLIKAAQDFSNLHLQKTLFLYCLHLENN